MRATMMTSPPGGLRTARPQAPSLPSARKSLAPLPLPRPFPSLRPAQLQIVRATPTPAIPATAADCVNQGLELFQKGETEAALALFQAAMEKRPNSDEARAATYNMACALTKLKRWQEAAENVKAAVNEHDLKLMVAMKDPDLAALRERREFQDLLYTMTGYVSKDQMVSMRTESKNPFRFARVSIFGALLAGAGLGLLIIIGRLAAALKGGEGAPDLTETLQNLGINSAAVAVLGALVYFDVKKEREQKLVIDREEELATLQVFVGPERQVTLLQLRQQYRPIILAGSKSQVTRAMKAAEPFKKELMERGCLLLPVMYDDSEYEERITALKAEIARTGGAAAPSNDPKGFSSAATGSKDAPSVAPRRRVASDRWRAEAAELKEWKDWFSKQKAQARLEGDNLLYIQVQLDGTVRASGKGVPPYAAFVDDIPVKGTTRSKLMDEGQA